MPLPQGLLARVCLALALSGALLATVRLDAQPFWVDEAGAVLPAKSIHESGLPRAVADFDTMPWQIKHGLWDPATPLYRYALAGFTAVAGFDERTTRAFSLLMGAAAAVPLFLLARSVFGATVAWLSVAFLLASPTWMFFAREARHYTMVILLVTTTLWLVQAAGSGASERAKALWPVALLAALLTQTLAYALLPVIALYALLVGPRALFTRRHLPVYVATGAIYLAVLAAFWDTLPFFHPTDCTNRPAGCQESPWYYVAVLHEFLRPAQERYVRFPFGFFQPLPFSLLPLLFLAGLGITAAGALRASPGRDGRRLVLLWLVVPFVALSASDVKFPRYLFQWTAPLCALLPAVAVGALAGLPSSERARTAVGVAAALLVVAAPQLVRHPAGGWTIRSGARAGIQQQLLNGSDDNFQRMRWQVEQLAGRVAPDDAVVTSYDDASLGFYLDRPVYGFLSSRRNDAFFVDLLARAERENTRVWFVDTLPRHDYCLSDDTTRQVACAEKYRGFYTRCLALADQPDPVCVRLSVPKWER